MSDMVKGNHAFAEAAVRAGARFYAGYPITPSTEIMEYLSTRMEEVGGVFIQAENEGASMNILTGASASGVRCFTASSSVGMTLKQEAISHMADSDLPFLAFNVVRYGNGLGTLDTGQSDYHRDTRGGGSGDYRCIVLAPYSIPEAVELISVGFDLSDQYLVGTIIHTEAALGQMMEPCDMPEMKTVERRFGAIDGTYSHKRISPLTRNRLEEAVEMKERYERIKANEQRWESEYVEDADYVLVAYGLAGRSVIGAVKQLREEGHKVGYIRPITLWPYPEKAFEAVNPEVKGYISVEENATGQMVDDIALTLKKTSQASKDVFALTYAYGVPAMKKIKADFIRITKGEIKEVY
ncbi:MAG: 3-methyl-2-oxobutanoate dehydrogenase subunit beta [Clostridia bacterium]|nr:3-methyl-2-oxobutanoate dehydrogenase subunit beta [Clostridia bacterium]